MIKYNYCGIWKNLGEEEAKKRIEDLITTKGYTEEEAFTEIYSIECNLDDE